LRREIIINNESGSYVWGFEIEEDVKRQMWFKLRLSPNMRIAVPELTQILDDPRTALPLYDTTNVVTQYLKALRLHTEQILQRELQVKWSDMPIEYVITVPSPWIDNPPEGLLCACAEHAGMGSALDLHVLSEPEAAAVYSFHRLHLHDLNVGDGFTLCDAGGGTVDLISYRITQLIPRLEVEEISVGNSAICGSSMLDRVFEMMLNERFEGVPEWNDRRRRAVRMVTSCREKLILPR
jgi:hypothetical protein